MQLVDLTLSSKHDLGPAARQSQDGWRWGWVQWMTISVLSAPLSSLCIPQCAAGERLHVRFTYKKFLRTICRSPDFARWGRHTRNHQKPRSLAPHLVLPACRSGLPGCGRCTCYSYLEPQVRVECPAETRDKQTTL